MKFLVDITPISEGGDESSIVGCFPLSVLGFAVFSSILIFILYYIGTPIFFNSFHNVFYANSMFFRI